MGLRLELSRWGSVPSQSCGEGGYFTREIASLRRGLGVEILLEIDAVDEWYRRVSGPGHPVFEPPQVRPWGLKDFRIIDPDGYYLHLTSRA
jgi:lactoylglutathione lyase